MCARGRAAGFPIAFHLLHIAYPFSLYITYRFSSVLYCLLGLLLSRLIAYRVRGLLLIMIGLLLIMLGVFLIRLIAYQAYYSSY